MAEKKKITTKKVPAPKKEKTAISDLPSLTQLFQDAWQLFQKTWLSYLKLVGLSAAYVILLILVGVLIALPLIFVSIGADLRMVSHLTPFQIIILILLVLWAIVIFLSFIALNIIIPIVSIFILQGKKTESLIDLIKQSKGYFWMVFLTSLLTWFVVMGGIGLFVIPGLFITFFFAFVTYEVVLEKQSGTAALQRSYFLVRSNFWGVLGRLLLIEVAVGIVSSILNRIAFQSFLLTLVYILYTFFIGWYVKAYVFLLYKELRSKTMFPQKISIRWIWLVSWAGWLLLIVLLIALINSGWHFPWTQHTRPLHRLPNNAA